MATNIFRMNIKIIRAINSCDWTQFEELIDEVLQTPNPSKLFKKKYYVWNIIRPRDFYKSIAHIVVTKIQQCTKSANVSSELRSALMHEAETLIESVLSTTKSEKIRKSFIWNIVKQVPLLTKDTILYASEEKIYSVLTSNKMVITDQTVQPFLTVIHELEEKNRMLQEELDVVNIIND